MSHQIIDLFKKFKVVDLKEVESQGKVQSTFEQTVGKKILQLEGKVSSDASVIFPKGKNNSLGLNGNYMYFQVQVSPGQIFVLIINIIINGISYKLDISNLHKSIKKQTDTSLQIPCQALTQWGTVILDCAYYLSYLITLKQQFSLEIKSIEIKGYLKIKNIYNCDYLHEEPFPQELNIYPPSHKSKSAQSQKQIPVPKVVLLSKKSDSELKENVKKQDLNKQKPENKEQKLDTKKPLPQQKPNKGILKQKTKFAPLQNKSQESNSEVESENESSSEDGQSSSEDGQLNIYPTNQSMNVANEHPQIEQFSLRPKPLLKLSHLNGFTGTTAKWLDQGHLCYTCGTTLVLCDIETGEQKYCLSNMNIAAFSVDKSNHRVIVACENKDIYLSNKIQGQKPAEIIIFDYHSGDRIKHFQIPGFYGIVSMDCLSKTGDQSLSVLVCALDQNQRQTLVLIKNDHLAYKQICKYHVTKVLFITLEEWVSIGRQSIRFWKPKAETATIPGHSVHLGEYSRDVNFTDLCIINGRILTCCSQGRVFSVSLDEKEIVGVWQVGEGKVYAMMTEPQYNFVVTSHQGGELKCWKNDFSEVILTVKSIEVLSFDQDKNGQILCAQANQSLSVLNVKNKQLSSIAYSHRAGIQSMSYHQGLQKLITGSQDQTIRIWKSTEEGIKQEFEFRCLDSPITVVTSLQQPKVLIGFESGLIRVVDLNKLIITQEILMDIGGEIQHIASSQTDSLILIVGKRNTIVFNSKLQETKKYNNLQYGFGHGMCGFNFDDSLHYVSGLYGEIAGCVQIYKTDNLAEHCIITLKQTITCVNFNSSLNHLLISVSDHQSNSLRRYKIFQGQAQFIQEVSLTHYANSLAISPNNGYVFATKGTKLVVWDYAFRGDSFGNPERQFYETKNALNNILIVGEKVFASSTDHGLIFIWSTEASLIDPIQDPYKLTDFNTFNQLKVETAQFEEVGVQKKIDLKPPLEPLDEPKPKWGQNVVKKFGVLKEEESKKMEEQKKIPKKNQVTSLQKKQIENQQEQISQVQPQEEQFQIISEQSLNQHSQKQRSYQNLVQETQIRKTVQQKEEPISPVKDISDIYNPELTFNIKELIQHPIMQKPEAPTQPVVLQSYQPPLEEFEKINIKGIVGYTFDKLNRAAWSQNGKFYVLPAANYLSIINLQSNSQIFKEQPGWIIEVGLCNSAVFAVLNDSIRLYEHPSWQFIKQIDIPCQKILSVSVSPCNKYFLVMVAYLGQLAPHIQLVEISSGRIITSSILTGQSFRQNIFMDFILLENELQFVILTSTITQLWRLSQKQTFELLDLDCSRPYGAATRSACSFINNNRLIIAIGQEQNIILFDARSARLIVELKNVTQQPIIGIIGSDTHLLILTQSPNMYFYILSPNFLITAENHIAQIISLDSIPSGFSNLYGHDIIITSKSGQVWFCDLNLRVTLKIQKSPLGSQSQALWIQTNKEIITAGQDGTVLVLDSLSLEAKNEFLAPKRNCLCITYVHEKIAAAYDDHCIRFFQNNKILGYCNIGALVTSMKSLNTPGIICGTQQGLCFIVLLRKELQIQQIAEHQGFSILSLDVINDIWTCTTINGKVCVYEKKQTLISEIKIQRQNNQTEDSINDQQYYLIDQIKVQQYDLNKSPLVVQLSSKEQDIVLYGSNRQINLRNFRQHLPIRNIDLSIQIYSFYLKQSSILVADDDGQLAVYEYETGIETDKRKILQVQSKPKGFQNILTQNTLTFDNIVVFFEIK